MRGVWKRKKALTDATPAVFTPDYPCDSFQVAVEWTAGAGGKITVRSQNADAKKFADNAGAIDLLQASGDTSVIVVTKHGSVEVILTVVAGDQCTVYVDAWHSQDGGKPTTQAYVAL